MEQATGSAKSKWGELTDDDLAQVDGERERLVGKVQEIRSRQGTRPKKEVDEWAGRI